MLLLQKMKLKMKCLYVLVFSQKLFKLIKFLRNKAQVLCIAMCLENKSIVNVKIKLNTIKKIFSKPLKKLLLKKIILTIYILATI